MMSKRAKTKLEKEMISEDSSGQDDDSEIQFMSLKKKNMNVKKVRSLLVHLRLILPYPKKNDINIIRVEHD